jgi:cytoplasmic iron level regulating protein YaaA (DUF328/UPF0246 family)
VLLLLPPSEGKTGGGSGPALGPRPALSTPQLAAPRQRLVAALRRAARADPDLLATGLRLPAGRADAALAANRDVTTAPTRPALDRYAGVAYAALDVASLTSAARRRAEQEVLVLSGLWGVVRGADPVPDYRVPAGGTVAGIGGVTAHWRGPLAEVLPGVVGDEAVLDLRSTDYRAMWRPAGGQRDQVVAVRVLAERGAGARRTVAPVSHHAKTVKGLVVRHLVSGRHRHRDPMAALADAAAALGLRLSDTSTRSVRSVDLVGRIG